MPCAFRSSISIPGWSFAVPLELASFPSIILIGTMFRLVLSIASTRLILAKGEAGEVIDAFGNFVTGGNLVVGFVIFIIITIVQFMVITKGSERIAEVAARFALDAMPGKQMQIDGDFNQGLISPEEAAKRRDDLARESSLYGSMDIDFCTEFCYHFTINRHCASEDEVVCFAA